MTYAQLMDLAARHPDQLTADDHARLLPQDRAAILRVINAHADRTDMELARLQRSKRSGVMPAPAQLIGAQRWAEILHKEREGTLKFTDLSEHEIWAIDNDPRLKAEFEGAV